MKTESRTNKLFQKKSVRYLFVLICAIFVLGAIGIGIQNRTRTVSSVLSLRENWDKLETSVHKWYPDAYLTHVIYELAGKQASSQINAEYHSPSSPDKTLYVSIDTSGKVKISPFDEPYSKSANQESLEKQDWQIDGQEAIDIFAKDKFANSCFTDSSVTQIDLSLDKMLTEKAAWRLDCVNSDHANYFALNAQTGELINP